MNRFSGLRFLGPYLRPYRGRGVLAACCPVGRGGHRAGLRRLPECADRSRLCGRAQPEVLDYALASMIAAVAVLAIASATRFYFVSWLGER